jgi:hypothetical protein
MKETRNMMTAFSRFLVLALFGSSIISAAPAQNTPEKLSTNLKKWRTEYAPEKVYVHHDKPYYAAGQQIWLKAYVLNASTLRPSTKSHVLYVELISPGQGAVQSLKLKIDEGSTHGDIALPDHLPKGFYRLIAYTKWMQNFGEETYFSKDIMILGRNEEAHISAKVPPHIDLQFFPEGGDMVSGINSRIAFKAVDEKGRGVKVSGSIYNDRGKKITDFTDQHLGMGSFFLQPEPGHRYHARITLREGTSKEFSLPNPLPEGYVLTVDETSNPDHLQLHIAGNTSAAKALVLTVISRDELAYSKTFTLKRGDAQQFQVAKKLLPTGIARINLSSALGEPLAERLVFVNHHDQLNIAISSNRTRYQSREEVKLELLVTNKNGQPVATELSIAVTDDELVSPDPQGVSLQTYLLLNSDLKGYIEQPRYYFEDNSAERQTALQLLVMTHGWRRFAWKDAHAGNFPDIRHPNETSLSICGRLVNQKGNPVKKGEVLLYVKDQHISFIMTETDDMGKYCFEGFDFRDSIDMVIQGTDAKGRRTQLIVEVDKDEPLSPPQLVNATPLVAFHPSSEMNKDFYTVSQNQKHVERAIGVQSLNTIYLKEVIVMDERIEMPDAFRLHQSADVILYPSDIPIAPSGNILEVIQGRVAGVNIVRTGPNEFHAIIRGQGPPLYLLDGIPIHENTLMSINQLDIARIEILKNVASSAIYGGRAGNGVIALYTRTNAGYRYVERLPGRYIIIHRAGGFSKVREFYSPNYSESDLAHQFPDMRTTVYWNPSVQTDEKGRSVVTFFTADRSTTYRAIVEGVSADGVAGRKEVTFSVKPRDAKP